MVLCIVALIVFSIMSVGSAKYRIWAREALRCVIKNLTLSPCDVALEQKIKGKVTAKLLAFPGLARLFYRHFRVISWLFTITFFASLIYTAYSIYNLFVFGSCEPGGFCYITWIGWCILQIERLMVYIVLAILTVVAAYFMIKRVRRSRT